MILCTYWHGICLLETNSTFHQAIARVHVCTVDLSAWIHEQTVKTEEASSLRLAVMHYIHYRGNMYKLFNVAVLLLKLDS